MRIGIDARTLSGRYTGDRSYWRGLITGLASIDSENEYVLYTRLPLEGEPPEIGPNFRWRTLPSPAHDALWMLFAFPRALREDKIDVAHTQYNIPLLGTPCPVLTTVHDISFALHPELFLPRDRWILNTLVPRSMQRAARVIAVSESTRRDILRHYKGKIVPEKVMTILEAADPRYRLPEGGQESAWAKANTLLGLDGTSYILAVGVLQPRKNLTLLLDAFALMKLGPKAPPHKLVVVGKRGWKNEALDRKIAEMPSEVMRDVVFAGYVEDDDLPVLYAGADAFCYPSLYEGFGLPPLEAMACGCPVLCARTSSLPEVVGDAGILLPAQDSDAWATALEKLLGNPAVLARWRQRGPQQAAQFSWERAARETQAVYQSVENEVQIGKK